MVVNLTDAMMPGGWDTPEVARSQREFVEQQLDHPQTVGPFNAFLEAMRHIPVAAGMKLLDLGCGVGHYGVLLSREYPALRYSGYDASRAMIAEARDLYPAGRFRVRSFWKANLDAYDIVLAAQVIEYQADPWKALRFLMTHSGWTIVHRLRLTPGPSHWLRDEPTYCRHRADNYLWNFDAVLGCIAGQGCKVVWREIWEHNATLVVTR